LPRAFVPARLIAGRASGSIHSRNLSDAPRRRRGRAVERRPQGPRRNHPRGSLAPNQRVPGGSACDNRSSMSASGVRPPSAISPAARCSILPSRDPESSGSGATSSPSPCQTEVRPVPTAPSRGSANQDERIAATFILARRDSLSRFRTCLRASV
jgi:hypothetical protein